MTDLPACTVNDDSILYHMESLGFQVYATAPQDDGSIKHLFHNDILKVYANFHCGAEEQKDILGTLEVFTRSMNLEKKNRTLDIYRSLDDIKKIMEDYSRNYLSPGTEQENKPETTKEERPSNFKSKYFNFYLHRSYGTANAWYENESGMNREFSITQVLTDHCPEEWKKLSDPQYQIIKESFPLFDKSGSISIETIFPPTSKVSIARALKNTCEDMLDNLIALAKELANDPELITEEFIQQEMNAGFLDKKEA